MRATKIALMKRLMLTLMVSPRVSESQPITGWVNDEVTLYAVTRSPCSKIGVTVLGDEERQDSREHRHVDVGDHVGSGKTGDGIFHAAGRRYTFRFSRSISTSISCTSFVWKAKVRFIGNAPPIFSVISAFCAVYASTNGMDPALKIL